MISDDYNSHPGILIVVEHMDLMAMKLSMIVVIVLALIATGSSVNGVAAQKKEKAGKNGVTPSEPQRVVRDYFAAYIAYQEYDFKKGDEKFKPVPDRTLYPGFVTEHFIHSYKKLMQEDEKSNPPGEEGYLDYDPIICGQDFPDNTSDLSVTLVDNTGTEATVKVCFPGFSPPAPFIVKSKRMQEGWRIDAIFCDGEDFDATYQRIKKLGY